MTYVTFFSFPPGTEMFHFPGCASSHLMCKDYCGLLNRVSHSEISGSKVRDTSPKRIAASRVFHRHVEPRHPPYALNFLLGNLEIIFYFFCLQFFQLPLHCLQTAPQDKGIRLSLPAAP